MASGSELWLLAMSILASTLGGMLGMASGIFIVPILTLFGHVGIHAAIGASLVSVIACSCGSAPSFLKARLTNIRLAIVLEVATTAGALTGVLLAGIIPVRALLILFALIMLLSAWQMAGLRRQVVQAPARDGFWTTRRLDSSYPGPPGKADIAYRVDRLPLGMAMMYGAGMISALLGIGSGVLKIPAMDNALRLPIKVSSATSNFMIGVTATAGASVYFLSGAIDVAVAGPVALGSVIGAILGARILTGIEPERLRILFAIVLLALAVEMLLAAFGIGTGVMGG
jgi:uncharacterized membrane protein YfcA